jgi:predicted MPP superfamily phosphohydrolase
MQENRSPRSRRRKILKVSIWGVVAIQTLLTAVALRCWLEAGRDPIIVRYDIHIPAWHKNQPVNTIAFLSDTHVSGDFAGSHIDPARLSRIIDQVNRLHPDIVVLGGDYITGKTGKDNPVSFRASVAPFKALKAPGGVYGVLGNHDYERDDGRDSLMASLRAAGVHPLVNSSVNVGPFVIAGVDDLWFGKPDPRFLAELTRNTKPVVLVSHNPDIFPSVPSTIPLTLSGHTHGAQIVPPVIGPIVSTSQYGQRYRRGLIRESGHDLIVTSGIGGRPFRWNVPPEIVLMTIGR